MTDVHAADDYWKAVGQCQSAGPARAKMSHRISMFREEHLETAANGLKEVLPDQYSSLWLLQKPGGRLA